MDDILGTQRGFWLTFGLAFALWQISGSVRAAMRALNDIYGADEQRPLLRRLAVSLGIAAALAVLLGLAVIALQAAPRVASGVGPSSLAPVAVIGGWIVAFMLMAASVAVLLRFAPQIPQSSGWLGFVTVLVVGGWALASVGFGVWATTLASYGTIYSSLGVVILLLTYLYLSAIVFLAAVQIDAIVRHYADDST